MTSSFITCFNNRSIVVSVFGEQLIGPAVDIPWFDYDTALSYYTFFNLLVMLVSILFGFWKREATRFNPLKISVFIWKTSILLVAISVAITGLTRMTFFFATLHNMSEFLMAYTVLMTMRPKSTKKIKGIYLTITISWSILELSLALGLPIADSYLAVATLGFAADVTNMVGWIIVFHYHKVKAFPLVAVVLHTSYVFFLLGNCLFVPWGRVLGLLLNTVAVFVASLPIVENSWIFDEFWTKCLTQDRDLLIANDAIKSQHEDKAKTIDEVEKKKKGDEENGQEKVKKKKTIQR